MERRAIDGIVAEALDRLFGCGNEPVATLLADGLDCMLSRTCELAHAPRAWVVDARHVDPSPLLMLYHELYNCCARRQAADTDCAEADPVLLLVEPAASCVASARSLFFERLCVRLQGAEVRAYSAAPVARPVSRVARACRELTLVLDLNGILVDKIFDPHARDVPDQLCHARYGAFAIVVRPGAGAFLRWALHAFGRVVVWSSLRRDNVHGIVRAAFGADLLARLAAVLGNEDSPRDDEVVDIKDGRNCAILKDLDFLAERIGGGAAAARMIIVDDAQHKVRRHLRQAIIPRVKFTLDGGLLDPKVANDRGLFEVIKPAILIKACELASLLTPP